ncbi:MAG TPA: ABC transporter permease [Opitutaceae bacterium]|nr:ABC transporter permease [Opitutaceae bacterium]
MKRILTALVFFAALVAAWQIVCLEKVWSPVLVPPPKAVALFLWDNTFNPWHRDLGGAVTPNPNQWQLFLAIGITLKRLLAGYVIGLAVGLPMGLVTARFRVVHDTVGVLALGLQGLPSVCWVPLALLWFGQTEGAMLFVVVMGTLWSVVLATEAGVRNVNPIYIRAARTMGSRWLHIWLKVVMPASLPFIVSGMKQGWAFAWRSLMAAEIFVTILTGFGLGQVLHYGRELNAMDQVIGIMVVIVLIGLLADKVLFSPWERFLHRRWGTG